MEEIRQKFSLKNRKFLKLSRQIGSLQLEILQRLPEDAQELLIEYERLEVLQGLLLQDILYKKGVIDGIRLTNLCRKVLEM